MNKEQIEQIAREEWENLGAFVNDQGQIKSEWEFWLKAFKVVLSKYKFTEGDMMAAFDEGAIQYNNWTEPNLKIHTFLSSNDAAFIDWLRQKEHESRTKETGV